MLLVNVTLTWLRNSRLSRFSPALLICCLLFFLLFICILLHSVSSLLINYRSMQNALDWWKTIIKNISKWGHSGLSLTHPNMHTTVEESSNLSSLWLSLMWQSCTAMQIYANGFANLFLQTKAVRVWWRWVVVVVVVGGSEGGGKTTSEI